MTEKAIIAKIDSLQQIPKANTIQVGIVLGSAVIISKDYEVGTLGVFFPEGLQLSEEFFHPIKPKLFTSMESLFVILIFIEDNSTGSYKIPPPFLLIPLIGNLK